MYSALKHRVYLANMALTDHGLITLTWGNASEIDREAGVVAIKPSGVKYEELTEDDIVVLDLSGRVVEGSLRPSSDAPTHLEMYRSFPEIGGIVHTHSRFATVFSQAQRAIPPMGTTHADAFYGAVECTRRMTPEEVETDYEENTGRVIAETVGTRPIMDVPAVLVSEHGPFTWGADAAEAIKNAVILEEVAAMAWHTALLGKEREISPHLMKKHYERKHGKDAYYGQEKK